MRATAWACRSPAAGAERRDPVGNGRQDGSVGPRARGDGTRAAGRALDGAGRVPLPRRDAGRETARGRPGAARRAGHATRRTRPTTRPTSRPASGTCTAARPDPDFLAEMWPTIERAIDFVVRMQQPYGGIAWAHEQQGKPWRAPLLTGSSSTHGSLVCARAHRRAPRPRSAALGVERAPASHACCATTSRASTRPTCRSSTGRHSMDWYYPVLGGALRGRGGARAPARPRAARRLLEEGVGCRCVKDRPWYTDGRDLRARAGATTPCGLTRRAAPDAVVLDHRAAHRGRAATGPAPPTRTACASPRASRPRGPRRRC